MALDNVQNFARTALAEDLTNSETDVTVNNGNDLPDPANGEYNIVVWDDQAHPNPADDADAEIMRVTAKSTNTLTVTRGQEGTTGTAHSTGYAVANLLTAKMITDIEAELGNKLENEVNDLTSSVTWENVPDANITQSSVTQHEGAIDHDALNNYVAAEHIDWTVDQGATDIDPGNYDNTQLTDEQVQDAVYNNVLTGAQTLINVTYDDANNEVDYVVDNDLSNYDNSTSGFISDITGEPLTDLSDVDTDKLQAPADGDVLTYDGTDWQAETPSAGVDVNGTPTAGNLAQFVDSDTIEDSGTSIASGTINQNDIYVGNASNEMVATDPSTYSASNFDISTLDTDIESQINSQSSTGTLTPDLSSATKYYITALAGSLTVAAPTNSTQGDTIVIVISDDGTSRSVSYNSTYVAMGAALPTSTTTGKRTELIAHYDGTDWLTSSTVEQ